MATVLVTGGVGFIGYHVTRALLARGDDVIVVDDFSDAPYPMAEKLRNEADLRAEFDRVRVVRACVTDRAAMAALADQADGVLHLAGLAGVRPSFRDPVRYARVNVEGTAVAPGARERARHRALSLRLELVGLRQRDAPARRGGRPRRRAESPYAASKRAAELVAGSICRNAPAMRCAALRFFTVYGPRQRPEMAITHFMRRVLAGEPITLFGDGSMRRDFTHVDDIVRGILAASTRIARPGSARTTSARERRSSSGDSSRRSPRPPE